MSDENEEKTIGEEKTIVTTTNDVPDEQSEYYMSGLQLYTVLAAVTVVTFLNLLDTSIIATAIPTITTEFNSLGDVGWYGSVYQLAVASCQPLTGKLYSNFPIKITYLCFFFLFELGSLLCAVSVSSKMLIISRAVAGIGASGLMNGALTILSVVVPMPKRPAYMGTMMGMAEMGLICGPLLGGAFTEYATWRWCFYINLPLGAVVVVLLFFCKFPQTVARQTSVFKTITTKLDLVGFALFAPAAIQCFLALDYGGTQYSWDSATVIGLFCGAAGTFVVFLIWEYFKGDEAMIPFSMARRQTIWSSCWVTFFFCGMIQLGAYYLPIYFQSVKGKTAMLSGVYTLPNILTQLFSAVLTGKLIGKFGYCIPFMVGGVVLTSVANGLLSTLSASTTTGKWVGYQIVLGLGRGMGFQIPIVTVQTGISPKFVPIALGLVTFSQSFGGAVFLTVGETILTNSLTSNIPKYAPDVDPATIIAAGASGFRDVVGDPVQLAGVIEAYAKSIDDEFYMALGCLVVPFFLAWAMGWKDIRKKEEIIEE